MRFLYIPHMRPRIVDTFSTDRLEREIDKMSRAKLSFNLLIDIAIESWLDLKCNMAETIYNFRVPTNSKRFLRLWKNNGKLRKIMYVFWTEMSLFLNVEKVDSFSDITSYLIITGQLWQIITKNLLTIQDSLNKATKFQELQIQRPKRQQLSSISSEMSMWAVVDSINSPTPPCEVSHSISSQS